MIFLLVMPLSIFDLINDRAYKNVNEALISKGVPVLGRKVWNGENRIHALMLACICGYDVCTTNMTETE